VLLTTFVLFPLFGLAFRPLMLRLVTPALYAGILFLCTLPSTVQSSIAFTAIAKGNVPAAVCSASASSIIGIFVTPVVVSLVLSSHLRSGSAWRTIGEIVSAKACGTRSRLRYWSGCWSPTASFSPSRRSLPR
jgi:sodium/bile acid cotransporter 7